mgnify:CR=1 FL=1|tara:strand:+ start:3305 stop:3934 length:630 start_codon:yes stop_codon:yes gene_type:complete
MTTQKKNIYQRINAVMQDVQYVQKDKAVSGGGANYKAVTHDQLVSVIRAALVKHGIVVEPKQTEGKFLVMRDMNATPQQVKMGLYSGWYDVHFVNIDYPADKTCITVEAHANDNGDKAPGKALTYAVKSAMLKQFTLETGENDESREEVRDPSFIGPVDVALIKPLLITPDGAAWTDIGGKLAQQFRFNSPEAIKQKDIMKIKRALGIK